MDAVFAVIAEFWVTNAGMRRDTDRALRRKFERLDPAAFGALVELETYPSMVERLGEITCPTTVIVGEHDTGLRGPPTCSPEHRRRRLVVIEVPGTVRRRIRPERGSSPSKRTSRCVRAPAGRRGRGPAAL